MPDRKLVNLHVEMMPEQRETLAKYRGEQKWLPWLLSIPSQLREKSDEIEKLKLRLELAEKETEAANERCKRLQLEAEVREGK